MSGKCLLKHLPNRVRARHMIERQSCDVAYQEIDTRIEGLHDFSAARLIEQTNEITPIGNEERGPLVPEDAAMAM
jgi:hypothetical protein